MSKPDVVPEAAFDKLRLRFSALPGSLRQICTYLHLSAPYFTVLQELHDDSAVIVSFWLWPVSSPSHSAARSEDQPQPLNRYKSAKIVINIDASFSVLTAQTLYFGLIASWLGVAAPTSAFCVESKPRL